MEENYNDNTAIEIRKSTVLVKADEDHQARRTLYERNFENSVGIDYNLTYNTTLYWDYKDWYLTGIWNFYKHRKYTIDFSYAT